MAYADYSVVLTRRDGGATITYANTSNTTRVVTAPAFEWLESRPKKVTLTLDNASTVAVENFLSSSFNQWTAGSGALALGDYLTLSYWPTNDTQLRELFYGVIVSLEQEQDGLLRVIAKDYLEPYENTNADMTIFSTYRDSLVCQETDIAGYLYFTIPDANPVIPFAGVGFAYEDLVTETDGTESTGQLLWDVSETDAYEVAYPFVATGNGLIVAQVDIASAGTCTSQIRARIREDKSGTPGNIIATTAAVTEKGHTGAEEITYDFNFVTSSIPLYLNPGSVYWLQLEMGNAPVADIAVRRRTNGVVGRQYSYYRESPAGSWTSIDSYSLAVKWWEAVYEDVPIGEYRYVSALNRIYMENPREIVVNGVVSIYRGMASYYYGTVTHKTITERLIQYNYHSLDSATSANQSRTFGTYTTQNKSLADCLREVCAIPQTAGDWSGYRQVVSHYKSGASNYIKIGRRFATSEAAAFTISHGNDSSTDNELRIVSTGLSKKAARIPSMFMIVGEGYDKEPVVVSTHSYARSASPSGNMRGFTKSNRHDDKDIKSDTDAALTAISVANYEYAGVIEGEIVISGCFPNFMDITTANETFGSGKVIQLNYSPMGISEKVRVVGVVVNGNETRIIVNNQDILVNNDIKNNIKDAQVSKGFYAPLGQTGTIYVMIYDTTAVDDNTAYMQLLVEADVFIQGHRPVLCTKYADTANNLNIYHAVFDGSSFTLSASPINIVDLTDNYDGTDSITSTTLSSSTPTINRKIHKWKGQKLIIDYTTKIA